MPTALPAIARMSPRPEVPVYLIDPNPVNAGGRVQQIQKGASEGMKELLQLLQP